MAEERQRRKDFIENFPWTQTPPYTGFQSFSHCQDPNKARKKYASTEEYFKELRSWLQQAYYWQSVTAHFPYYLMSQQAVLNQPINNNTTSINNNRPFTTPPQTQEPPEQFDGLECRIPSFWKRFVAEMVDFTILLILKLVATYFGMEMFENLDIRELLGVDKDEIEYESILKMTEVLVFLELLHRIVVCLFETFWLKGGVRGKFGGASPGKTFMKLRVVRCETVTPLETNNNQNNQGMVVVRPGTDLGIGVAFLRGAVKNFVLAVLIPTSFALFYFPNNRTGYDMISNTIVIEEPIRIHRPHRD